MAKYVCDICNWEYDEEVGIPDKGIAPGTGCPAGTKWEELAEDFKCPLCGAPKDMFTQL
ncbi:rubredoxin [[Clostridium] innocuum]|nr:rubredoxin [[Clostridium] innocuum]